MQRSDPGNQQRWQGHRMVQALRVKVVDKINMARNTLLDNVLYRMLKYKDAVEL